MFDGGQDLSRDLLAVSKRRINRLVAAIAGPDRQAHKVVPITNRSAVLDIPVGAWMSFREEGLVGCMFDEQRGIEVPEGNDVLSIQVSAEPAGGMFGRIQRADGSPATDASVTVIEIEEPPSGRLDLNPSIRGNSHGFFRTVPFGGRYAVLAREFNDEHAVWAVSETFAIDEHNPIQELNLTLGAGERTIVAVVDAQGHPVVGAPVEISISHKHAEHSRSERAVGLTDRDGLADFGRVQMRGRSGDTEVSVSAEVEPFSGHTGWHDTLDPSRNEFEVVLQTGVSAAGTVVDHKTEKPLPDQPVVVYPADFDAARYAERILTNTDDTGRFQFDNLEPIRYRVVVPETVAPEAVVIKRPDGSRRFEYPIPPKGMFLTGGSDTEQTYKVQVLD